MVVTPEGSCSPAYRAAGARPGSSWRGPTSPKLHGIITQNMSGVFDFCLQSWKVPKLEETRAMGTCLVGRLLRRWQAMTGRTCGLKLRCRPRGIVLGRRFVDCISFLRCDREVSVASRQVQRGWARGVAGPCRSASETRTTSTTSF